MLMDGESVKNISRQILRFGAKCVLRQFYLEIVHLMHRHHRIEPAWHGIVRIYRAVSVTPAAQRDERRTSGVVAYAVDGMHRVGALVEVLMTSKNEIDSLAPREWLH